MAAGQGRVGGGSARDGRTNRGCGRPRHALLDVDREGKKSKCSLGFLLAVVADGSMLSSSGGHRASGLQGQSAGLKLVRVPQLPLSMVADRLEHAFVNFSGEQASVRLSGL